MTKLEFKLDKNASASIVRYNKCRKDRIDIESPWPPLNSKKARLFAKWLLEAADAIDKK